MTYPGTVHFIPSRPGATVTVAENGPGLWEITLEIDGVLWTSWAWGSEDRDKAERQARRLVEATS
jgi:hypothetical protein